MTLEHAFVQPDGSYLPKLANGIYTCRKGTGPLPGGLWKLDSGLIVDTFQVMDVPPFMGAPVTDLLIHPGNYNTSSKGCICVGMKVGIGMIEDSVIAFNRLIALQAGLSEFTLTVS